MFYIKKDNEWQRDEDNKDIKLVIKKFNNEQTKKIIEWKKEFWNVFVKKKV